MTDSNFCILKTREKVHQKRQLKIKSRITVKKIHPPVASFTLSFVLLENSATFSTPEFLKCILIIACGNVDIVLTQTQFM